MAFIVFRIATGYFIQSLIYLSRPQAKKSSWGFLPNAWGIPSEKQAHSIIRRFKGLLPTPPRRDPPKESFGGSLWERDAFPKESFGLAWEKQKHLLLNLKIAGFVMIWLASKEKRFAIQNP